MDLLCKRQFLTRPRHESAATRPLFESRIRGILREECSVFFKITEETNTMLVEDMLRGNAFATAAWPNYAMGEDVLAATRSIKVPVLVISGELDIVEPVERLRIEVIGNIEHAQLVVVPGSGHLLPVEAPQQAAGYIESFVKNIGG